MSQVTLPFACRFESFNGYWWSLPRILHPALWVVKPRPEVILHQPKSRPRYQSLLAQALAGILELMPRLASAEASKISDEVLRELTLNSLKDLLWRETPPTFTAE